MNAELLSVLLYMKLIQVFMNFLVNLTLILGVVVIIQSIMDRLVDG